MKKNKNTDKMSEKQIKNTQSKKDLSEWYTEKQNTEKNVRKTREKILNQKMI